MERLPLQPRTGEKLQAHFWHQVLPCRDRGRGHPTTLWYAIGLLQSWSMRYSCEWFSSGLSWLEAVDADRRRTASVPVARLPAARPTSVRQFKCAGSCSTIFSWLQVARVHPSGSLSAPEITFCSAWLWVAVRHRVAELSAWGIEKYQTASARRSDALSCRLVWV